MTAFRARSWQRGRPGRAVLAALAVTLAAVAAPSPAQATAKLWLYPDSDDPRAGGHVVTEPAFTLNIDNRGTGNGDNTAYDTMLIVAVNDPTLLTGGSIALPGGTVDLDPAAFGSGTPMFACSGRTVPPHSVYPASYVEIPVGDIAPGEVISAGVIIDGGDGIEVHFDATATGYKQAGPNLRCYDVINPSGHDVTMVLGDAGGDGCPEVAVSKIASSTGVVLGDPVDYVITVENPGTCDLTDVVLVEDIPTVTDPQGQPGPAFTIVGITPDPSGQTPDAIEWAAGTLAPGDVFTATVSVVFDQPGADGQTIENTACATSVEIPDPQCSTASVTVGSTDGDEIGGPGFWCNQIRFALEGRPNAKFTVAELDAWLLEIFDQSGVFPEQWPLIGLLDADAMLCRPNLAASVADRLARHLLTLWFNVVSERLPPDLLLGDLCPGDEEPPADMDPAMSVAGLIAAAEADILGGADDEILGFWIEVIDFVNNAYLPGSPDCITEPVSRHGNRRHGAHRP